jgi:hypothetical protein
MIFRMRTPEEGTIMRTPLVSAWLTVAVAAVVIGPAGATMVRRMELDGITQAAARIVHGTVTHVQSGRDESGLPATWFTLTVSRTLKGAGARRLTIKQYGVAEPLPDGTIARIAGVPRYRVGDEVILFLHAARGSGFTSPVGLGQGTYRVSRTSQRPSVRNDLGERRRDLDEFLSTVDRLATATE